MQRKLEWHVLRPHSGDGFPSLEDFLDAAEADPARPPQTDDEMAAVMGRFAVGGGITRTYPPGHPMHKA